jgi:GTP:adenosylcobinamide-phosphate guanylyltransferase
MIAAVMCGGKGTRMGLSNNEKPLLKIKGKTLIGWVISALLDSQRFVKIVGVSSPSAPQTSRFLQYHYRHLIDIIEAEGANYSDDLCSLLDKIKPSKTFVVSADLPLLSPKTIRKIVKSCTSLHSPCISIVLEEYFVRRLGIKPSIVFKIDKQEYCHSGIMIIDSSKSKTLQNLDEYYLVMNEKEIAVNVNTPMDLNVAKKLIHTISQERSKLCQEYLL